MKDEQQDLITRLASQGWHLDPDTYPRTTAAEAREVEREREEISERIASVAWALREGELNETIPERRHTSWGHEALAARALCAGLLCALLAPHDKAFDRVIEALVEVTAPCLGPGGLDSYLPEATRNAAGQLRHELDRINTVLDKADRLEAERDTRGRR